MILLASAKFVAHMPHDIRSSRLAILLTATETFIIQRTTPEKWDRSMMFRPKHASMWRSKFISSFGPDGRIWTRDLVTHL